jgi:tRNA(adenine34) deaminase
MWSDLNYIWKEAFSLAWESFKRNTIPIGALIVDQEGKIISRGRNRIYDETSNNPLAGTYMAHAEMTAMISLKEKEHPNVKQYVLYTTMEPCPMCFGTMVMMGIRNIRFAARDGVAGAAELNNKMDYIKSKGIEIKAESAEMEVFQICLQTAYEYMRSHNRMEEILNAWRVYCSDGVNLGGELHHERFFIEALNNEKPIDEIYNEVVNRYLNK